MGTHRWRGPRRGFLSECSYWARNFVDSIARGDDYTLLRPCISILWFKTSLLGAPRFHSEFLALDRESGDVLSPEFEIHVLELPKLHLAKTDRRARLDRWARFLRATSVEEFEELARKDAIMSVAKNALEELSLDPEALRIARERETAVLMHRHLINSSREVGRAEGLLAAIESMCAAFGLELTAERRAQLAQLDADQLRRAVDAIAAQRTWPEDLQGDGFSKDLEPLGIGCGARGCGFAPKEVSVPRWSAV